MPIRMHTANENGFDIRDKSLIKDNFDQIRGSLSCNIDDLAC